MRSIHTLPHRTGGTVLGLTNVRGELLICASLTELLGLDKMPQAADASHCTRQRLLVVNRNGDRVAFPVDQVHGTHRFHPRELKEVPATIAKAVATYIRAILPWGEKTVGMLDDELLLYSVNHNLA
jgi:chemotaxis-related protein WspD